MTYKAIVNQVRTTSNLGAVGVALLAAATKDNVVRVK